MLNLISIEKSRKKAKTGDIFVLQPKKDLYLIGQVIYSNIKKDNSFINKQNLYIIFNLKSNTSNINIQDIEINNKILPLIHPVILTNQVFSKGYFKIIGNIDCIYNLNDVAFYNFNTKLVTDINDNISNIKDKKLIGHFGLSNTKVVESLLNDEYNNNPEWFEN